MHVQEFKQPIFGANYLQGFVSCLRGMGLQGASKFKLTFRNGGAGVFLHYFFALIEQYRIASDAARAAMLASMAPPGPGGAGGGGVHAYAVPPPGAAIVAPRPAYVDPSDPSVVFLTQPAVEYVGEDRARGYSAVPTQDPDTRR